MRAFMELEAYKISVNRLFGRMPALLMAVGVVVAYIVGIAMTTLNMGDMVDPFGFEGFANAFFRGVFAGAVIFYASRMLSENGVKKAHTLLDREAEGVFIPCMSHKTAFDLSYGSLIVMKDRFYFEPERPFGGDLSFDYDTYEGFQFSLGPAKESIGLFLITGEPYMLHVLDAKGTKIGRFIVAEPEKNLPLIQEVLTHERQGLLEQE